MSTFLSNSVSSILNRVKATSARERGKEPLPAAIKHLGDFERALKSTTEPLAATKSPGNTAPKAAENNLEASYKSLNGSNLIPIENLLFRDDATGTTPPSPDLICKTYNSYSPPKPAQPTNVKFDQTTVTATAPSVKTPPLDPSARFSLISPDKLKSMRLQDLENIIVTASHFHGVEPNLSLAVARTESSMDPKAVSTDGFFSKGLFQLLDETGKYMADQVGMNDKYDPYDPAQNTHLGISYIKRLQQLFSTDTTLAGSVTTYAASSASDLEKLSIAAFNAGEGNVARAQAQAKSMGRNPGSFDAIEPFLPASTRSYVKKVRTTQAELNSQNTTG